MINRRYVSVALTVISSWSQHDRKAVTPKVATVRVLAQPKTRGNNKSFSSLCPIVAKRFNDICGL